VSDLSSLATTTILLDALRNPQDAEAWQLFDQRYRPIVSGFSMTMGLDEESAGEIAQETLARFVESYRLGRYERERGRLRSWILGVARHLIADRFRESKRSPIRRGESALGDLSDDHAVVEAWGREQERHIIALALDELRSGTRAEPRTIQAFELAAIREVPPASVAEACGFTVDEVYRIKHRLGLRLRSIVERLRLSFDEDASP